MMFHLTVPYFVRQAEACDLLTIHDGVLITARGMETRLQNK
uniref:Uncharacterized protein n=1 Tax=Rhizophora mucronata TaxID=61149 RepID=A0A2P2INW4_RHIMU